MSALLLVSIAVVILAIALIAASKFSPKGRASGRPPVRNPGPPAPLKPGSFVDLGPRQVVIPPGMQLEAFSPTVIVVAPQGAGKSLYAHELSLRFGCTTIVDDWDGVQELPAGALALTNMPLAELAQVQP